MKQNRQTQVGKWIELIETANQRCEPELRVEVEKMTPDSRLKLARKFERWANQLETSANEIALVLQDSQGEKVRVSEN